MLIDWFTVSAQIINFLILVWLLKRYLYKPILSAIDQRDKRIKSQLEKAEAMKVDAQKEREAFQHKNEDFERQREALLNGAEKEAATEKQRLIEEARKEYEVLRSKQKESLKTAQTNLNREIIRRTQSEVFAIARKILADLASETLEDRMVEVFNRRLLALKPEEKKRLTSSSPALVRTSFELSQAQRTAVESALKGNLNGEMKVRFEIAPDLVSGIELTANGNKIAWSIANYLDSLENSIVDAENLDIAIKPNPSPGSDKNAS